MQGQARTTFRSIDWTRLIKDAAQQLLEQQYADIVADGDHPSPYLEGLYDGACAMLHTISPEVAVELVAGIDDQREP